MNKILIGGVACFVLCGCQPPGGAPSVSIPSPGGPHWGAPFSDLPCPDDPCGDPPDTDTVLFRPGGAVPAYPVPAEGASFAIHARPAVLADATGCRTVHQIAAFPALGAFPPDRRPDVPDIGHDLLDLTCDERPDPLIRVDGRPSPRPTPIQAFVALDR